MKKSNIYELQNPKPMEVVAEIHQLVEKAENNEVGAMITLYRMWEAGRETAEELEKEEYFKEMLKSYERDIISITMLSEKLAIAKIRGKLTKDSDEFFMALCEGHTQTCYTFEEALLMAACLAVHETKAFPYVARAIGLYGR